MQDDRASLTSLSHGVDRGGDGCTCNCCMCALNCDTKSNGSFNEEVEGGFKNSPGTRRVVPDTISAAVDWISSFSAVRIPRSTSGRESIHADGLG